MKQFQSARRAAVPLIAIESADPIACRDSCVKSLNGKKDETPVVQWTILDGLTGVNKPGVTFAMEVSPGGAIESGNPSECLLLLIKNAADGLLVFFHNAHRFIDNEGVRQGLCTLRDLFKSKGATMVLLAPSIRLPAELSRDVVVISEPLPDRETLGAVLDSVVEDAGLPKIKTDERPALLDTVIGLSCFEAEQAIAMSISKDGINRSELWNRKVKAIEATNGLTVYRGKEKFCDVGGVEI